jgi:hypothetical protein
MVEVATRVLIAGGGVAALEAALALRELGEGRVSVEMLAPEPEFWYRPLAVAEPFGLGEVRHFDLAELAAAAGATFSPGALSGVDAGGRLAQTSAGGPIPYDTLLVACGAGPTPAVPGALTFRGPADTERIRRLLQEIVAGQVGRVALVHPSGTSLVRVVWMGRLVTVEFGPSRSRRFGRALSEAQSGAGECREAEPGRYRARFVLGEDSAAYTGLARLLERVRHWRATEVCEDDEPVSAFHAKEMAWCASFQLTSFRACRFHFGYGVLPRCSSLSPLRRRASDPGCLGREPAPQERR